MIVIHAYDVSLRASKKKEQQLQSQLATVEQESQDREQQLSKLEDENYELHKEMVIVKYENEQQQEQLKRLQQKGNRHTSNTYYIQYTHVHDVLLQLMVKQISRHQLVSSLQLIVDI